MAKPAQLKLLLIRSGRTDWDESARLCGQADLPLTQTGRAELLEVLEPCLSEELSIVMSAGDEASVATSELVAGKWDAKLKEIDGLAEINLGLWEGLRREDLVERYPRAYKKWLDDPTSVSIPEGESMLDAEDRILRAIARALEKAKPEGNTRIGIVLKPIAFALVRAWALGEDRPENWEALCAAPAYELCVIDRERLREARERARAEV